MIIDSQDYEVGNKAMAAVLLLYYHLLDEGGITNDQTVYVGSLGFNGDEFLEVEIREEDGESLDIDVDLIRKGAIVYLLCELNDVIGELEDEFHQHPHTKKLLAALDRHQDQPIPEVSQILELVSVAELDYSRFNDALQSIYRKYVRGFFAGKLA